jgi:hypothetical protein
MRTNEKIFLNELSILLRSRLTKFSNSPKAIAKLINRLIYVPDEAVSFQDIIQTANEACTEINIQLQEEDLYIFLDGLRLDNDLQPVFSFYIEIMDEDLKLNLSYMIEIGKTIFKQNKLSFEFDSAFSKSYVWERLTTKMKSHQIFGSLKKS